MLNGYKVVKNFIAPSFADYLKNYFTVIAENGHCKGGDDQAPNSYCIYGDPAFDTLMLMTSPIVENEKHFPQENDVILFTGNHYMKRPSKGRRIILISTIFEYNKNND